MKTFHDGKVEWRLTRNVRRRDLCGAVARRMAKLTPEQAAWAWHELSLQLELLERRDVPKFWDLLCLMRICTVFSRKGGGIALRRRTREEIESELFAAEQRQLRGQTGL